MTEEQAKQRAKQIVDNWYESWTPKGGYDITKAIADALVEAAKAPEPPKPVKTRGEEVAETLIVAREETGACRIRLVEKRVGGIAYGPQIDIAWPTLAMAKDAAKRFQRVIRDAIDRERADAEAAERERCAVLAQTAPENPAYPTALQRVRIGIADAIRRAVQP